MSSAEENFKIRSPKAADYLQPYRDNTRNSSTEQVNSSTSVSKGSSSDLLITTSQK